MNLLVNMGLLRFRAKARHLGYCRVPAINGGVSHTVLAQKISSQNNQTKLIHIIFQELKEKNG